MCSAVYARKEMGMDDSFAFISPCIAKKMEISDPHNKGLVQYNVTFDVYCKSDIEELKYTLVPIFDVIDVNIETAL